MPSISVFHCAFSASASEADAIPESAGASLKAFFFATISVVSHHNVSSMTDDATGVFTVNFASNLANANYMVTSTATSYDSDHTSVSLNVDARSSSGDTIQLKTTSQCKFICNGGSTTEYDPAQGYCGFWST